MKPSTRFELVMWCSFAAFYVALAALVWCVLFAAPLQVSGGMLLGAAGLLAGAHHARAIHQDNKIVSRSVRVGADDDWEKGEA